MTSTLHDCASIGRDFTDPSGTTATGQARTVDGYDGRLAASEVVAGWFVKGHDATVTETATVRQQ